MASLRVATEILGIIKKFLFLNINYLIIKYLYIIFKTIKNSTVYCLRKPILNKKLSNTQNTSYIFLKYIVKI